MRPNPSAKLFIWVCASAAVFFIVLVFHSSSSQPAAKLNLADILGQPEDLEPTNTRSPVQPRRSKADDDEKNLVHEDLKYILQWTPGDHSPFHFMGKGRSAFVKHNCEFTNCYVTDNRGFFLDQREFDAVAFNGRDVLGWGKDKLPKFRGFQQKYIYANMESSHYYPACSPLFDGFFNWTWTYRLDSDVRWGYVTAFDLAGNKVGPAANVKWLDSRAPLSEDLKETLSSKTKAVAWFVSNCHSQSKRESFVETLKSELVHYGLSVDVYGNCGNLKCPRSNYKECNKLLARDYFFYLSFENSFAEDYVTEKLFTALENFAVPIVFGAANYSRFLPPGSYLNARELGAKELALIINQIIQDKTRDKYHDFFKWRTHYYYQVTSDNADVCNLCALMNDRLRFRAVSVYQDFRSWWNPPDIVNLCP